MKKGDKVAFHKLGDGDRIGRIVGVSEDGKKVAVRTHFKTFIVSPPIDSIIVIRERK